jgi:dihydroneopterin aldolase
VIGVTTMAKVRILNMMFYGFHGVYEYEREQGQKFYIDVEIEIFCYGLVISKSKSSIKSKTRLVEYQGCCHVCIETKPIYSKQVICELSEHSCQERLIVFRTIYFTISMKENVILIWKILYLWKVILL